MLTTHRPSKLSRIALVAIGLFTAGQTASAQSFRAPSTLRYGSGLFNVPVASVLPHMTLTGTYSGFTASIPEFLIVDPEGDFIAVGSPYEKWLSDATVAVGLLDLIEIGASLAACRRRRGRRQHVRRLSQGCPSCRARSRAWTLPWAPATSTHPRSVPITPTTSSPTAWGIPTRGCTGTWATRSTAPT